jgi:hypothetical protein
VVFFQLLTQSDRYIERVAMRIQEGTFAGARLETEHLNLLFASDSPQGFDADVRVAFFNSLANISFAIAPENQMRRRLNEPHDGAAASYIRWAASAEWEGGGGREQLPGITEYLRVRLNSDGGVTCRQHR